MIMKDKRKKKIKPQKQKETSLFRKIIEIHYEQALARKALRRLSKQEWSVEFLASLVAKAARLTNSQIEIVVVSPAHQEFRIRNRTDENGYQDDDDILNKLDDTAAINAFIARHAT